MPDKILIGYIGVNSVKIYVFLGVLSLTEGLPQEPKCFLVVKQNVKY